MRGDCAGNVKAMQDDQNSAAYKEVGSTLSICMAIGGHAPLDV